MRGSHAVTRRLVALAAVLAVVATGCATNSVPTPAPATAPAKVTPSPAMITGAPSHPNPTAALSPPVAFEIVPYGPVVGRPFHDLETSAHVTIEVQNLRDMAGLDLVEALLYVAPNKTYVSNLLRAAIDASPFSATPSSAHEVPSGHFRLVVFAGQPPCEMGYGPACQIAIAVEPGAAVDYFCTHEFDLQPGDDSRIVIDGLPPLVHGGDLSDPTCTLAVGS